MPQISQFFGISIYMYYDEHNPPHFHVIYGKNEGQIGISPLALIEGKLSGRVLGLAHCLQVKPFGGLSRAKPAKSGPILDECCLVDGYRSMN